MKTVAMETNKTDTINDVTKSIRGLKGVFVKGDVCLAGVYWLALSTTPDNEPAV
jgi:hypothetical protein